MKNFVRTFCIACAILAFVACGGRKTKAGQSVAVSGDAGVEYVETKYPIEVDLSRKYPKRTIVLQDVAEVSYVPFETGKEILMDNRSENRFLMSDSLIITYNRQGDIFIMGRDGSFLSKFNRMGRGPGEYGYLGILAVDFDREEIYVYTDMRDYKIMVYSFAGEHKRTLSVPVPVWIQTGMKSYDKDNLLVYTTLAPSAMEERTSDNFTTSAYKKTYTPFYLVSKQTGEFKPLPIEVSEFSGGMRSVIVPIDEHTSQYGMSGYGAFPITGSGDDVILSDYACDTIWSFRKGELAPYIVPVGAAENKDVAVVLRTTLWSVLIVGELGEDLYSPHSMEFIGIDHKTGETFEVEFVNGDCAEPFGMPGDNYKALPVETVASAYSALQLVDLRDAGKLQGRLAEIAAGMKEDDNPVLMLIEFKK